MKKGFTLLELMIVIAIIGILAAIAIPKIMDLANQSQDSNAQDFHSDSSKQDTPRQSGEVYARYRLQSGEVVECRRQRGAHMSGSSVPCVTLTDCRDGNSYYAMMNVVKLGGGSYR